MNDPSLEDRLRADLTSQAARTPPPAALITRVLSQTQGPDAQHRRRSRRMLAPVLAASAVAAALVATTIAVAALTSGGARPTADPLPTASATAPQTSKSAPKTSAFVGVAGTLQVGVNGAAAWRLTKTSLAWTQDAGANWADVALPPGVASADVDDVAAASGRGLWLTAPDGPAVVVYRHPAGASGWTATRLLPLKPTGLNVGGASPAGTVTLDPGQVVTVVAGWDLTASGSYDRLFISTDDGATYVQHPLGFGLHIEAVAFSDAQHGLIVAGPSTRDLFRTADGGQSWQPTAGPAPGAGDVELFLGPPTVTGPSSYLLPETIQKPAGDASLRLYQSEDGGKSFSPIGSAVEIPVSRNRGYVFPALSLSTIWMPAQSASYQSRDGGATWQETTSNASVDSLAIVSPSTAIGVISSAGCPTPATRPCTALVITTDSGRTWTTF